MTESYPLHWPEDWPRSERKISSKLRTSLSKALDNVHDELRRFGNDTGVAVKDVVISSNYTLTDRNPKESGVAVYFTWEGISTCIAVDRYLSIEENLQAIAKVVEAERTKMRHGGLNLVRAAFRGYAALPPPNHATANWHLILGVERSATLHDIHAAYKRRARIVHPDHGGSTAQFQELQDAYREAQRARA